MKTKKITRAKLEEELRKAEAVENVRPDCPPTWNGPLRVCQAAVTARRYAVRWRRELVSLMNERGIVEVESVSIRGNQLHEFVSLPNSREYRSVFSKYVIYTNGETVIAYRRERAAEGMRLEVVKAGAEVREVEEE